MIGADDVLVAAEDGRDTLSILVATDNHLGYNEKDSLRGNDSFDAFEEILAIARERQVDCILLGGDLFHENRPSRRTLHRTLELFRHYCMGSRPCALELLSDPSVNFPSKFGTVNYEDPNYNVAIPVFAIHGNHDDPTGDGNLSSIDLLATAGLLNYFGKTNTVDDICITPILLRKGHTRLALFGLGAVRDERLHRTFLQRKVCMMRPPEPDAWFNMMILHQNRSAHGPTSYIPESFLDEFLDLVIWGHEHECLACEPTVCPQRGFTVFQPGSSVATSLSEGETRGKHVVILEICGKEFSPIPVPLKSVRPFLMRDLVLRDATPRLPIHDTKAINAFLTNHVEAMIAVARKEWEQKQADRANDCANDQQDSASDRHSDRQHSSNNQQNPNPSSSSASSPPPLPLIRIRVDYSGETDGEGFSPVYAIMNPQRFGQQFVNRIANPRDVVQFFRRKAPAVRRKDATSLQSSSSSSLASAGAGDAHQWSNGQAESMRVEDLVSQFLANQRLDLLPQNEFCDILQIAVAKDDRDAIESFVKQSMDRTLLTIRSRKEQTNLEKDSLRSEFERSRRLREDEWQRLHPGMEALLAARPMASVDRSDDEATENDGEEDNDPSTQRTAPRGRGRGRARVRAGARASAHSRTSALDIGLSSQTAKRTSASTSTYSSFAATPSSRSMQAVKQKKLELEMAGVDSE